MEEDALEDEERTEDKANSSLASSVAEPEVVLRFKQFRVRPDPEFSVFFNQI